MASPVDTSVKFFNENMPDAPVLNGVAGSFVGLLHACLVTGFGLRTVTSLVVSGGVATITLPNDAKNPNLLRSVVLVEGVTGPLVDLNGEQRVTFASPTELKFATAVADGTAAGSITVKTAPAGFERVFTAANKAVFKSLAIESFGTYLWVNDTGTVNANVRSYEAMTGVDSGTGAAPTVVDSATGGFWIKSSAANSNNNRWDLFADTRAVYYAPVPSSGANAAHVGQATFFQGDIIPYKSGDAFAAAIFASKAATSVGSVSYGSIFSGDAGSSYGTNWLQRSYSALGSAAAAFIAPTSGATTSLSGLDTAQGTFPVPTDGGLRLCKILCAEGAAKGTSFVHRGELPGAFHCPQTGLASYFQRGDTLTLAGRTLYVVHSASRSDDATSAGGRGFIDITGPWR